jgi:hypothetical protein
MIAWYNYVGDTDSRNNGRDGEFPQLLRPVEFFTPPTINMIRIFELAEQVKNG